MNREAQLAICFFMLATCARGQQVASVDLTHVNAPATPTGKQARPNPCELPRAIGDGFVEPPDQEPRDIVVEMADISDHAPRIGSVVQGEVRLRNSGGHPFQIPWSVDPTVRGNGQNPQDSKTGTAAVEWEEGSFNIYLQGSNLLKNFSQPLFSSKSAPGSQITIGPGEWVTVKIKFKIETAYPYPQPEDSIKEGDGRLQVQWEQTAIAGTMNSNGCLVGSGFFHYLDYYKQQNPAITIKLH
jgi:hypothetical protein